MGSSGWRNRRRRNVKQHPLLEGLAPFGYDVDVMKLEHWNVNMDGPLTEEALRRKLEKRGYRITRYVYPPGTSFPDHTHSIDKMDAVLSGRFRIVLEGQEAILEAGDCLAVPRGAVHSAEVVGDEPVVSLDAIKG